MGKVLIMVGLALLVAGILWLGAERIGVGRLPGDIVIERENFRLYLPLGTSIVISIVASLIFWIVGRYF